MIAPQHINESFDVNEHTIDPATAEKLKALKDALFYAWEKHSVKPERTR
ncbi:hypothetical protein VSU19_18350 [Verrucomicrobiales bacterium BCK34]|nr:hypothetical protein [Verrucomicrobiales bacterium BCK34]